MHDSSVASRGLVLLVLMGVLSVGAGCSSSQSPGPTTKTDEPASRSGPALSLLYTTPTDSLMLHNARDERRRLLVAGATAKPPRAVSPSGRYLAFSYATADSSRLALLDLTTQQMQRVHAVAGRAVTYSLAWHPDQDRLAVGHYRPTDNGGRGPGGVRIASPDGTTRDVGCSSVREVLHWLPDGSLSARTDDTLYAVDPADCTTQTSLDIRRMHFIRHASTGQQMAYIHRELEYDRDRGEYVPDSSFVLSDPGGGDAETLFGDERRARHHRWAPAAHDVALDVRVEASGHRQVVVYDGSRPTFLVAPDQTTGDQVHPRWSPSGNRLAFTLRTGSSQQAAVRMQGQTRRLGKVDGAVWGWLDDRSVVVPGPDSVRVQSLDGTTRYTHPAPETLLHAWRRPAS
ncbi:PD40 domain-containing protein [Salinibacter altiplanensis]|uniref:PD40 domain-containing protein n=1 Tax=Salinibacter altiplanensis TaxID=1803181 RepID=UPI000C9ED821|nr:PD40 domain-containing protein [Salinibacter altiplanensis]